LKQKLLVNMVGQYTSSDHPTDETFERLVLHNTDETELGVLEAHIFACDSCLTRVQDLQKHVRTTKLALEKVKRKQMAKTAAKRRLAQVNHLTRPVLLVAGLSTIFAARLFFIPSRISENTAVTEVNLSAYRDSQAAVLPQGRPLHLMLDAVDLPDTPALVKVVNPLGSEIWRGDAAVVQDKAEVLMPPFATSGTYLLRLYAPAARGKTGEILREYVLNVR
jgi:hypothetical protein